MLLRTSSERTAADPLEEETMAEAKEFRQTYGPWGFVAGASTGTGLALSNELAVAASTW